MYIPIKKGLLRQLFVPRYDELSLFLMSLSFTLLCFLNPPLRAAAHRFLITEYDWRLFPFYALIVLFISGMASSFYHALCRKRMTPWQQTAMLYFAVMANGLSGIAAGAYLLPGTWGLLAVFPIWNMINGLLLLLMYRFGIVDETLISDEAPSAVQLIAGGLAVTATFVICQFVFDLNWAITFSICVAYATNLNQVVGHVLPEWMRRKDAPPAAGN